MIATALVVGGGVWWYRGKKLGAGEKGEKEKDKGGGVVERVRGVVGRFVERKKGKGKEEGGGQGGPSVAAAGEGDGD